MNYQDEGLDRGMTNNKEETIENGNGSCKYGRHKYENEYNLKGIEESSARIKMTKDRKER